MKSVFIVLCSLLVCSRCQTQSPMRLTTMSTPVDQLQPLNVMSEHLTLSGFSSGGTFAQMLQFCYSSLIDGVATFSHNYYRCGPPSGYFRDYDRQCTQFFNTTEPEWYEAERVHTDIQDYYSKGIIESPDNLRDKRLYSYTGLRSAVFSPTQAMNILRVYERYIRNPEKIRTRVQDAAFVMPTDKAVGIPCTSTANARDNFYIANCGFSGAFEALEFILADNFKLKNPNTVQNLEIQPLRHFDQKVFLTGLENHQMDDVGFYYVPTRCVGSQYPCLLHAFFHGCWVGRNFSGETFIRNSGYLEVAEANDIVMLFPQNNPMPAAPAPLSGCWDTFGRGGPYYATQLGEQVNAVWRMITHALGDYSSLRNFQTPLPSKNSPPVASVGGISNGNMNANANANANGNTAATLNPNPNPRLSRLYNGGRRRSQVPYSRISNQSGPQIYNGNSRNFPTSSRNFQAGLGPQNLNAGQQNLNAGQQNLNAGQQNLNAGQQNLNAGPQNLNAGPQNLRSRPRSHPFAANQNFGITPANLEAEYFDLNSAVKPTLPVAFAGGNDGAVTPLSGNGFSYGSTNPNSPKSQTYNSFANYYTSFKK